MQGHRIAAEDIVGVGIKIETRSSQVIGTVTENFGSRGDISMRTPEPVNETEIHIFI